MSRFAPPLLLCASLLFACAPETTPPTPAGATTPSATAPETQAPPTAQSDPVLARGEGHYNRLCALCHGPKGEGYAADNAPSLVTSSFLSTASDDFLRAAIERGRPGTAMGGFGRAVGGPLDPADVDALIAFIRARNPTPRADLPPFYVGGDVANGRVLYENECRKCHGDQIQRGNAVHLANPALLSTASDAFLRHAIVHGRPGTPMEGYAARLDGKAINDVVTYIRSFAGPPAPQGFLGTSPPMTTPLPSMPAASVPAWGPIPQYPNGGAPKFKLREGRFAPMVEVQQALKDKKRLIIVDARPPSDWSSLHIPGSVSLPYYDLKLVDRIPNDGTWVIAYCGCPHHASGEVVDELRRRGYKNTAVLDEGMFAWQKAGYPVVQAPGMQNLAAPPMYGPDGKPLPLPGPHGHDHHGHAH